ncbi:MAG: tetratricopeptide repeat protein, partial [Anaerolineae bacterium]
PEEMVIELEDVLDTLEEHLSDLGHRLGISPEKADELDYQLELGRRMAQAEDPSAALRYFRRAASIAPHWFLPRAMEMEVLVMSDRAREAVGIGQRLLAEYPDLVPAREVLVRAYIILGNREAAEEVARPLREQSYDFATDLELAVRALGYLNDDEGIYRLYRRHRNLVDEMEDALALIVLGSAAANLGHFRTARRLWDQAVDRGALKGYLDSFSLAAHRKSPGPGIADRYPTFQFLLLAPKPAGWEFGNLLVSWVNEEIERKFFQKRLRALVARYPVLLQHLIQLFREADDRAFPAELLALIGTPEALEELRRFAFSQKRKLTERMTILRMLADVGGVDPDQPVEVWDEIRQEWRRLKIPLWTVVEPEEPPYPPRVLEIVQEIIDALKAGKVPQAQERVAQALALAPDSPDLYCLAALVWLEDPEQSEVYLRKAVGLDPRHGVARIHLAQLALDRGDLPEAHRQLEALSDRRAFRPWEFAEYLLTLALVSLKEEDLALARLYTDLGLEWDPQDERFLRISMLLEVTAPDSYWHILNERYRQYLERKRTRPIRPNASLKECLERLDKESLIAMARVHLVDSANLRKEQLVERLVEALTDPLTLETAASGLSDAERQALRDVLDAGGVLSWEEFTARYGSDLEENQNWYYHQPE